MYTIAMVLLLTLSLARASNETDIVTAGLRQFFVS